MEGGGGGPAHESSASSRAAGARSDVFDEEAVRRPPCLRCGVPGPIAVAGVAVGVVDVRAAK